MALTICEILRLKQLIKDLGVHNTKGIPIKCNSQVTITIAANPVQHEKTKHVEIDCHFIRDKAKQGYIHPSYMTSTQQLADVLTKILSVEQHQKLLTKLGVQSQSSLSA